MSEFSRTETERNKIISKVYEPEILIEMRNDWEIESERIESEMTKCLKIWVDVQCVVCTCRISIFFSATLEIQSIFPPTIDFQSAMNNERQYVN